MSPALRRPLSNAGAMNENRKLKHKISEIVLLKSIGYKKNNEIRVYTGTSPIVIPNKFSQASFIILLSDMFNHP